MSHWLPRLNSISTKVMLAMVLVTILLAVLATFIYLMNQRVQEDTHTVAGTEIPSALLSIAMLDEIGDMNANVLEYVLGESEEKAEFEANHKEFADFLSKLKSAASLRGESIREIEALFDEYTTTARQEVFDRYNPEAEAWAKQRVEALTNHTGDRLERLLDEDLKQGEIDDAGSSGDVQEIINDDLPGVRLYLELVDEAGDMINDLANYQQGDASARANFINDSQDFEVYLQQLKPLEQKPQEIEKLKEVDALFKTLRDGGFEVFERYDPANKTKAIIAIDDLEHRIFSRLESRLDELSSSANIVATTSLTDLSTLTANNQKVMIVLISAVTLMCILLAFFAYRTVSKPITELSGTVNALAEGNTDIEIIHQNRRDEIGDMAQAMEVFKRNIIARNQAEKDLVAAKDKAEAASEAKANFLATMSHEIRTPMNGVIGMIDLLLTSQMNKEHHSMVGTIRDSAFSLLNIINDILDFSKIEAGKIDIEAIDFSFLDLIEGVCDTLTPNAHKSDVQLTLTVDPNIPDKVTGDPVRIRQILFNLIGNAIKFSGQSERQGEVFVEIRSQNKAADQLNIHVDIRDNGIGIATTQLEHLFQPFSQAESSTTRRFGGTGLGLAICKNLIDLMEGDITVHSDYGLGSTFSVSLNFSQWHGQLSDQLHPDRQSVIINCLENSIGSHLDQYLNYFNLHYFTIELERIGSHLHGRELTIDPLIIICSDRIALESELNRQGFSHLEAFNILEINHDARNKALNSERYIHCMQPLKISTLVSSINQLTGKEAIDAQVQGTLEPQEKPLSQHEAKAQGKLVLVAEDNITNQEVISRQLQRLGYACLVANDGMEAEQLYLNNEVNLVLTDCHMPRRDGYELTRVLRTIQNNQQKRVPIIAITANALAGESDKCLNAGMDDYISKPVELDKLHTTLKNWAPGHKATINAVQKQPETSSEVDLPEQEQPQDALHDLDTSVKHTIFIDDEQDYIAALQSFMTSSYPELFELSDILTEAEDLATIRELCHKQKSTARMIGATDLANLCSTLEQAATRGDKKFITCTQEKLLITLTHTRTLINMEVNNNARH